MAGFTDKFDEYMTNLPEGVVPEPLSKLDDLDKPLPKLFEQCRDLYKLMMRETTDEMREGHPLYVGFLTTAAEEGIGLSNAQYTRVVNTLKEMQCIAQYKRGAGKSPSQWLLIGEPELESFLHIKSIRNKRMRTSTNHMHKRVLELSSVVNDLIERVTKLEGIIHGEIGKRSSESGD